jgi:hypothetical protein
MTRIGRDKLGNLLDLTSHPTHAMNPIDRAFYDAEEFDQPAARTSSAALDDTAKAAAPCAWGAGSRQ